MDKCVYNSSINCEATSRLCDSCGWNTNNKELHESRINKQFEGVTKDVVKDYHWCFVRCHNSGLPINQGRVKI